MKKYWITTLPCLAIAQIAAAEEPVIIVTAPGGGVDADEAQQIGGDAIAAGTRPDLASALARGVPGITLSEAQGNPWSAAISWRGYTVSALQGTEQGVAVYLDGIRFNQPFGDTLTLDLLPEAALAGAQVLEPSPVYGRNALGGAILLGTATGADRPGVELSGNLDSFGGYGGSVSVGGKNGLIVLDAIEDHGWRDDSPSSLYRLFAQTGLARENWGINANVIAADTRLFGNGVAPVELLEADYDAVFTKPDINDSRFWRLAALPYLELGDTSRLEATLHYQRLRRNSVNGDLADFEECDADDSVLCLGEDDEGFSEFLRDPSGALVSVDPDVDDYAVRNRGRELTRGGGLGLQWLDTRETSVGTRRLALGVAWERYSTRFGAESELGVLEEDRSVTGLGTILTSDDGGITSVDVTSRLSDLAIFASAEIPLTPALSVEAGARWSQNRVRLIDHIGSDLNGRHRFRRLSPSVELDFRPAEGWNISAGFAETTRNPTPAELSCADPEAPCALANFFVADPPLNPVVARNYHAELRRESAHFNGHLALFRSDSSNDIRHIASGIRGRAFFANLGSSRRQGVELGGEYTSGPWRLAASYSFTDATFRSDFEISSPANPLADDDGAVEVEAGDNLPGIPRHTGDIALGYDTGTWGVEGNVRLRSGQYLFGDEGNDNPRTPAYAVFDMRGHVEIAPGIQLIGEVRNIFNRRYANFGTFAEIDEIFLEEAPDAEDPRAYAPGAPRRFSIAFRAKF